MKQLSCALALILTAGMAARAEQVIVASRTIYPGQIIQADVLQAEYAGDGSQFGPGFAHDSSELAGKVAARTILPGRAIALAQVRAPDVVEAGRPVLIYYQHAGLKISMQALPLASGSIGETIQLRNLDSGKPIAGLIRTDGTVEVERQ
jgi:flagellar basal body P-ring formation protein FlgA